MVNLFGIEFTTGETNETYKKQETYEITKKQLLEGLGFKEETVSYIQYDYKKGILTIKGKLK